MKQCIWPNCDRPVQARGLCNTHYSTARLHGLLPPLPNRQRGTCAVDGCERTDLIAHNLCRMHETRRYRNGDPLRLVGRGAKRRLGTCSVPGCTDRAVAKDLCWSHYRKARRHQGHSKERPV